MLGKWFSVTVLSVVGDESADETQQRVFAVSGVFGVEDEWLDAEHAWAKVTKGEVFHAADWDRQGRHAEYRALVESLSSGSIGGVVYALDLVAFNDVFPDTMRESAYMKCFTRVVVDVASTAERVNAKYPDRFAKVEFTFDNRPQTKFSAARCYGQFIEEPGWTPASLLADKLSFQCRTNPRIQMADLIAREGMKDLDRTIGPERQERGAKAALHASGKFLFFAIGRTELEAERIKHAELEKDGVSEIAYHAWLIKKRAQDTWDNKVRFLEYLDANRKRSR